MLCLAASARSASRRSTSRATPCWRLASPSVPGTTVDRQCGSGQQAIHFAAQGVIASGGYDMAVACGVESMTRVPMGSTRWAARGHLPPAVERLPDHVHQGIGAEMIAAKWRIPRDELDEFSLRSHQRAAHAQDAGCFDARLRRSRWPTARVQQGRRHPPRHDAGEARHAQPAFKPDGVITAGDSSQISDGAAALL